MSADLMSWCSSVICLLGVRKRGTALNERKDEDVDDFARPQDDFNVN